MRFAAKGFVGLLFLALTLPGYASFAGEKEKSPENDFSGLENIGKVISFSREEFSDVAYILNYADLVATNAQYSYSNVRIYHLLKSDHCINPVECPANERLYIAAKVYDDRPGVHALYLSPAAFRWRFLRWVPETEESNCKETCAAFEAEGEHVVLNNGKVIKKGKFEIDVRAYPFVAHIKQIK